MATKGGECCMEWGGGKLYYSLFFFFFFGILENGMLVSWKDSVCVIMCPSMIFYDCSQELM